MKASVVVLFAASLAILVLTPAAWPEEVRFPLTVDYEVLRVAVREHLQEETRGGPRVWRTADGCGSFSLREFTIEPADGRLKIAGPAEGGAGFSLFGLCWASLSWTGRAEIMARPEIGPDWQLRFRDLDATLYDASGRKQGIATRLFSTVKGWVEAELSTFTIDLHPPATELTTMLRSFAGSDANTPLTTALETLRPVGLDVEPDAVRVRVALNLPPAPAAPPSPEPALTPAQLTRWEAKLDSWDGFLSFVVKILAGENADPAVRDELLGLLLDARSEVVRVLARGPEPGADAVRQIFLDTWDRLRGIVRRTVVEQRGNPAQALRFVVFLAAGDALATIEVAAPAAGLDFSADGLRRLARSLDPAFTGDPLQQSDLADPRLQQLFHFRDPDAPPRRPRRKPPGTSEHWFGPRRAHAAETDEWRDLARRLDRWAPDAEELRVYREVVDRLLTVAAERSLDPDALDGRFDDLFHHLVKATAWQESCWRQFVRRGDSVTYLASPTGDVGLMQINVRIWRGFFSTSALRWNAAYNAGAGAEILQQLLIRYGTREARSRIENAARATYSAYHGGPARYRRYRTATTASRGWAVDRAFWEKYQAVAAGTAADRVLCLGRRTIS
jgi:hypothetical protein